MATRSKKKKQFSSLKLSEAMELIGRENLTEWVLNVPSHPPSEILQLNLKRLEVFDLKSSEQAKTLLIDAFLAEVISNYPKLKVWKAAGLETETLTGIADYLIAPRRAYLKTPLLCTVEAKRDDFEKGEVRCLAEMSACQWNNKQNSLELDVYGIVSNGKVWQYYKLAMDNQPFVTNPYGIEDLPGLLGALDFVCAACSKNVP